MIKLVDRFIRGTDLVELETLQALLAEHSPTLEFSTTENVNQPDEYLTYTMVLNGTFSSDSFLDFLMEKIDQVNQQS